MRLFGVCGGESMESKEYWLSRVEDWTVLRHVKEQTPEICMAAVQKDPSAIVYIRD